MGNVNMKNTLSTDCPLVSVLMTAFNRSQYIGEAIESVLNSSYSNFELIVVDDCSADSTVDIAKKYAEKDSRVHVYQNEENLGDYLNRNLAASYAKGVYIKYLDSDDVIYPHGLEVMVECMEMFPEASFGLSEVAFVHKPHPILLAPREAYLQHFLERDIFGRAPGSSIIRTRAFKDIGGFSGLRQVGDFEFWLDLSKTKYLVSMPRDLVWDRTHGEQEQAYDSELDKEIMRFVVVKSALAEEDCPLVKHEKILAFKKLYFGYCKTFWRMLIQKFDIRAAMTHKIAFGLSWRQLLSAIVRYSRERFD